MDQQISPSVSPEPVGGALAAELLVHSSELGAEQLARSVPGLQSHAGGDGLAGAGEAAGRAFRGAPKLLGAASGREARIGENGGLPPGNKNCAACNGRPGVETNFNSRSCKKNSN